MTRTRGLWRLRWILHPLVRLDALFHLPEPLLERVADWCIGGVQVSRDGGPWEPIV